MKKLLYALCFIPWTLHAQMPDMFASRVVTLEPSVGECVGNTSDMMCVFDTVIACAVRQDASLCERVGLKYDNNFRNEFGLLSGQDYNYGIAEVFMNRRRGVCSIADGRSCLRNPADGELVTPNVSMRDNNNVGVFLRRAPGGNWSVIFATQFACWPDEECS